MVNRGNEERPRANGVVLIVDDDSSQAGRLASFLMKRGIDVVVENNGYAAVNSMKRVQPAVVLLDVNVPGLDGLEVARLMVRLDTKPKFILMARYPDAIQKANQAGLPVHAVIDKPVPRRILLSFVRKALVR